MTHTRDNNNGNQPPLIPPKPRVELKRPDEVHAMEASRLMEALGKVSRGSYVLLMATMEDDYPGRGWRDEANKLEDWFMNHGLELSGKKETTIFR